MPHFVYILRSQASGRYYCGYTSSLERRVAQHNDRLRPGAETTHHFRGPWELVWSVKIESKSEALKLERRIKSRGIGRFLKDRNGC